MSSQGASDRAHRGGNGAIGLAWFHATGQGAPIGLADVLGHLFSLFRAEEFKRTFEKGHQQVVAPRSQLKGEFIGDGRKPLGRPTCSDAFCGGRNFDVPRGDESFKVVADHVGMKF